jgi:hypothetical protein
LYSSFRYPWAPLSNILGLYIHMSLSSTYRYPWSSTLRYSWTLLSDNPGLQC